MASVVVPSGYATATYLAALCDRQSAVLDEASPDSDVSTQKTPE